MTPRIISKTPPLPASHRHTLWNKNTTTTSAKTMPRQRQQNSRRPPSQKKPPLTHFLCLPLVTPSSKPQLEASIETFRNHVSPNQPEQTTNVATRIHPKAIRPVGVLHCTLGVMSLDGPTLQKAIDLLQNLDINSLLSSASPTSNPLLPTPSMKRQLTTIVVCRRAAFDAFAMARSSPHKAAPVPAQPAGRAEHLRQR